MGKNKGIQQYISKPNFEDNKPVNLDVKTLVDVSGQQVFSPPVQSYNIQGEIVELQKRHYGQSNINELLDNA